MGFWKNWQAPADKNAAPANRAARARTPRRAPLRRHPVFALLLALWGAALGAGVVMVLPAAIVEGFAAAMPGDFTPQAARLGLAGCAAALLALIALLVALALRGAGRSDSRPIRARRGEVQPLDPASELGSDSLDAPLPTGLFTRRDAEWDDAYDAEDDYVGDDYAADDYAANAWADDVADDAVVASSADDADLMTEPGASAPDDIFDLPTAWLPEPPRDYDLAEEVAAEFGPARNSAAMPVALPSEPAAEAAPAPRDLDLAAFGALPGRNAVWVEEPAADETAPELADPQASTSEHAPEHSDAIARLRAVPPSELSLCQLVERFAAALHDYQTARTAEAEEAESRAEREALLQEALSALSRATRHGLDREPGITGSGITGPARRAQFWADAQTRPDARGAA